MIDRSFLFKINSETDEKMLLEIYNTAAKRINSLRAFKVLPKVEEIKETEIKILLPEEDKNA